MVTIPSIQPIPLIINSSARSVPAILRLLITLRNNATTLDICILIELQNTEFMHESTYRFIYAKRKQEELAFKRNSNDNILIVKARDVRNCFSTESQK